MNNNGKLGVLLNSLLVFLWKRWRQLLVVAVIAVGVFLCSQYGQVTISSSGQDGGADISYVLSRQPGLSAKAVTTKSAKTTRLVSKGNYDVVVRSGNKSFVTSVSVGGFFSKKTVSAQLASEKNREYVGNGTPGCMIYNSLLYSYACTDTALITTHHAATATSPTYVTQSDTLMGRIKGVLHTSEGAIIVGKKPTTEAGVAAPYTAYVLAGGLAAKTTTTLGDLSPDSDFSFLSYKDGFIAYDTTFSKILYYPSSTSKPETISDSWPKISERPVTLATYKDIITATFSNYVVEDSHAIEEDKQVAKPSKSKPFTKVVIYGQGGTKVFDIDSYFHSLQPCGTNKICGINTTLEGSFSVYDVSGTEAQFLYAIGGVQELASSGSKLLLVRSTDIVGFDADARTGSIEYPFSDFEYCGLSDNGDSYLVCLIDNKGKHVALRIDPSDDTTNAIDKQVEELQKLPEVSSVSAYGKNLHVIPKQTADLVYDPAINSLVYDPETIKAFSAAVNQKIDQLGINRQVYHISGVER